MFKSGGSNPKITLNHSTMFLMETVFITCLVHFLNSYGLVHVYIEITWIPYFHPVPGLKFHVMKESEFETYSRNKNEVIGYF